MFRGMRSFTRASTLLVNYQNSRKTRSCRQTRQLKQQQPLYRFNNNNRFQLFNKTQKKWAEQIDKPPLILTEDDLKNWLTFKVDKLIENQLYFWHATQFDWIPLWYTNMFIFAIYIT